MKQEEARDINYSNSFGDGGYDRTMAFLIRTYDNPQVVFLVLVKDITKQDYFSYDKKGLHLLQEWFMANN